VTNALTNGAVVDCILTSSIACVTSSTATSGNITITVNSSVVPSVSIAASNSSICSGTLVTFTPSPVNGGLSPSYTWKVNGSTVGLGSTYSSAALNNGDVVTCAMLSNAACASPSSAASNAVTMTVSNFSQPAVTISPSQNPVCSGISVTYTATAVNAGINPSYQWKVNGSNVGVNSAVYTSPAPANGDVVTCQVTSSAPCTSGLTVTSNSVTMTVNGMVTPTVSITSTASTICSGASVTFTAVPVNGGTPTYQWTVNGVNTGPNSPVFTPGTINNNDVVSVQMTSNAACTSTSGAVGSNTITMTVGTSVTPAVTVAVSPSATVCVNTEVQFTATPANGGTTPAYQWLLNGANVGANSDVYTNATLNNGDIVSVQLTSNASCATQTVVVSAPQTMTVNPLPAAPTIAVSGNQLTSSAVSGNQWLQGGAPISGATAQTYNAVTSGWYAVEVTNGNGCSNISDSVLVKVTTGVEDVTISGLVKVIPNPFNTQFNVQVSSDIRDLSTYHYTVTDELGRILFYNRDVQYSNIVTMTEYTAGIYYVNVYNGSEKTTLRVVKED
jgi:hypothetical protein